MTYRRNQEELLRIKVLELMKQIIETNLTSAKWVKENKHLISMPTKSQDPL